MATITYGRARLTTTNDKFYRAHVEHYLLQRKNQRAIRPPRQRDIFGGQAEQALRDWIATERTLDERRILEYEERRGRRGTMKYRELDAIIIEDKPPKPVAHVFEAKASRTAKSLYRALAQLQETRTILEKLYPVVYATILLVNTGIPTDEEVAALMTTADAPHKPPQTLQQAFDAVQERLYLVTSLDEASIDAERIGVMVLGVDDIIALAGEANLALDWSTDDELEDSIDSDQPATSTYATAGDDEAEDGGALAAAMRRAGLG